MVVGIIAVLSDPRATLLLDELRLFGLAANLASAALPQELACTHVLPQRPASRAECIALAKQLGWHTSAKSTQASAPDLLALVLEVASELAETACMSATRPLLDAGLDSLTAPIFAARLSAVTSLSLKPTLLF